MQTISRTRMDDNDRMKYSRKQIIDKLSGETTSSNMCAYELMRFWKLVYKTDEITCDRDGTWFEVTR